MLSNDDVVAVQLCDRNLSLLPSDELLEQARHDFWPEAGADEVEARLMALLSQKGHMLTPGRDGAQMLSLGRDVSCDVTVTREGARAGKLQMRKNGMLVSVSALRVRDGAEPRPDAASRPLRVLIAKHVFERFRDRALPGADETAALKLLQQRLGRAQMVAGRPEWVHPGDDDDRRARWHLLLDDHLALPLMPHDVMPGVGIAVSVLVDNIMGHLPAGPMVKRAAEQAGAAVRGNREAQAAEARRHVGLVTEALGGKPTRLWLTQDAISEYRDMVRPDLSRGGAMRSLEQLTRENGLLTVTAPSWLQDPSADGLYVVFGDPAKAQLVGFVEPHPHTPGEWALTRLAFRPLKHVIRVGALDLVMGTGRTPRSRPELVALTTNAISSYREHRAPGLTEEQARAEMMERILTDGWVSCGSQPGMETWSGVMLCVGPREAPDWAVTLKEGDPVIPTLFVGTNCRFRLSTMEPALCALTMRSVRALAKLRGISEGEAREQLLDVVSAPATRVAPDYADRLDGSWFKSSDDVTVALVPQPWRPGTYLTAGVAAA